MRLTDWSRDGKYLLYMQGSLFARDLYALPVEGKREPIAITTSHGDANGRFSPDSKWIAYSGSEAGGGQIFIRSFPGNERLIQVSRVSGYDPQWRSDGRELYYVERGGRLNAVAVKSLNPPSLGDSVPLFATPFVGLSDTLPGYAPNADGTRFLVTVPGAQNSSGTIRLVQHWQGLLHE